jgi:hypothetical protein
MILVKRRPKKYTYKGQLAVVTPRTFSKSSSDLCSDRALWFGMTFALTQPTRFRTFTGLGCFDRTFLPVQHQGLIGKISPIQATTSSRLGNRLVCLWEELIGEQRTSRPPNRYSDRMTSPDEGHPENSCIPTYGVTNNGISRSNMLNSYPLKLAVSQSMSGRMISNA